MTGSRSPDEGIVLVMRAGVLCANPVLSIASPRVAAVPIFIASRRETSDLRMVGLRKEAVRRLPDVLASHCTKGPRVQSFWAGRLRTVASLHCAARRHHCTAPRRMPERVKVAALFLDGRVL